ncbi:MAG: nitrile hydratase subunit alpha [Bradyrhizobium sp.]|jgi:nitrile hydratase subunit alpha|uniref:nitrile hydratase subunit alpha n=1 Tax=Bradyrhizobium sp. TaxID=376 RepID=UPI001209A189|nr:nitrile hydratase subunit alpha [Bradyrhizobium sp.]THD73654.1 MAG: nitrile hydratase subunit alpha [Bradyrhizobium sp.]
MADHDHDDDHQHDHDHHHHHGEGHASELSEMQIRVRALETILAQKGYVDPAALDEIVETYEKRIGPHIGAKLVARAWVDEDFKKELLKDVAIASERIGLTEIGSHVIALENKPSVHHVVVCTLCSCYPWAVLGLPPTWYKSYAYRSRVVKEPRKVLADFGTTLPDTTEIRVWDSTAETRFIVIPQRPVGTEGWSEERLASIVSRDAMVGVTVLQPVIQEA